MGAGSDVSRRKELLRRSACEKGCFLRRIDPNGRVGGDQHFQPRRVIAMAMGDHYGVEAGQVHSDLLDVACEYRRIIARIEKNAPSAVLDERRKALIFL
jgi:hypothetical protein